MSIEHLSSALKVSVGQMSASGLKTDNEDSIGIRIPTGSLLTTKGVVLAIADGVSSAEAGKEAAESSVKSFLNDYYSTPDTWSVKESARRILLSINRWLYGQSQAYTDNKRGYICTLSIVILKSQVAHIFHIGDTRVYRIRGSEMQCLTRDHSIPISDKSSYLSRAMGIDNNLEIDYLEYPIENGDYFVLSSDGVHDFMQPEQLLHYTTQSTCLDSACQSVIQAALDNGSDDNLSCQMVRIDQQGISNDADVYKSLFNLAFPPDLSPGAHFEGWDILKEIYASQRSQLYLVQHSETGEKAVMKTPSRLYEDDTAYRERFLLEEWVGLRIQSPHVVKVKLNTRPKRFLYYLMEPVEGQTLSQVIDEHGPIDIKEMLVIVDQLVKGLRAFHRKETLHQDLKPENIIISKAGVKLLDFGSSKVAGVDEMGSAFTREQALGTMEYSAPEYRLQREPCNKSDQFSLAVICYEMITKKHPYGTQYESAQNFTDFSKLHYTSASYHNPLVPAWLDGALKKACSLSQELRYDSLSEFLYDLKKPNPQFSTNNTRPIIEKNPIKFWQTVSLILLLAEVATLIYFNT